MKTVDSSSIRHRCEWCLKEEIYVKYHDEEWGNPEFNDGRLFEFLLLEGAQAGLSWLTILKRREYYRSAFDNFDYEKISKYGETDFLRLMSDKNIIRNRLKIKSAVDNSRAFIRIVEKHGSFSDYIWNYVNGQPIVNEFGTPKDIPVSTPLSDKISKDMKKIGFSFFGTVICYSYLQAMGIVNDHVLSCHRHPYNL